MNYSKPSESYLIERRGHFTTKTLRLATQILSRNGSLTSALFSPTLPESSFEEITHSPNPIGAAVPYSRPIVNEPATPTFVAVNVLRPDEKGVPVFSYQFSGRVCGSTTHGLYVRDSALRPDAQPEWFSHKNIRPFHQN